MTFLRWLHLWKCSGATDCTSEPSFGFSIHLKLVIYLRDSKWFQMTRDKIHSPYMRLKKSKDGEWSGNFLDYKTSSFDYYCSIVAQQGNSQYTRVFCNKINLNLKRYPLCSTNCWSLTIASSEMRNKSVVENKEHGLCHQSLPLE